MKRNKIQIFIYFYISSHVEPSISLLSSRIKFCIKSRVLPSVAGSPLPPHRLLICLQTKCNDKNPHAVKCTECALTFPWDQLRSDSSPPTHMHADITMCFCSSTLRGARCTNTDSLCSGLSTPTRLHRGEGARPLSDQVP